MKQINSMITNNCLISKKFNVLIMIKMLKCQFNLKQNCKIMKKKKIQKLYKLINLINKKLGLKFMILVRIFWMEWSKKWKKEEKNGLSVIKHNWT